MSIAGQIVLITGGSRGIGKALAAALAGQGMSVVITGRDAQQLEIAVRELGSQVTGIVADAANAEHTALVVDRVIADFGRIDVLINNAGTAGPGGPLLATDAGDWWRVQEVNVRGPMLYMQAVVPHMASGTIINIGSYAGARPTPGNAAYATSKAALARLTDSVAHEVADTGISALCVSPGLVAKLIEKDVRPLNGLFLHVDDDIDELLSEAQKIRSDGLYQLGVHRLEGRVE